MPRLRGMDVLSVCLGRCERSMRMPLNELASFDPESVKLVFAATVVLKHQGKRRSVPNVQLVSRQVLQMKLEHMKQP